MKRAKKLTVLLLAITLWLTLPTLAAQALGGSCGDNVSWSLDDGVLTISGSGEMNKIGWSSHRDEITAAVVEEGVTSLYQKTFYNCRNLVQVSLPSTLTAIGDSAFESCYALTELAIPESVTVIGNCAFDGCSSLTAVNIPDGVTEIGYYTFYHCESLTELTIPEGVTAIGSSAFSSCCSLTSLVIPEGITVLEGYLCCECTALREITIPDSVTSIDEYAFSICVSLTDVYFGGTSGQWQAISVDSYGNENIFHATKHFTHWSEDPHGTCGDELTWVLTADGTLTISGSGEMTGDGYGGNGLTSTCSKWGSMYGQIKKVVIGNGVTSIYGDAFEYCQALESVSLPSSLETIGSSAFACCTSMKSITIPSGVTSIGCYAFQCCRSLTDVNLPRTLTGIGHDAFVYCTALTHIDIPSSVIWIDYDAFANCTALTSLTLPAGLSQIHGGLCEDCTALTSVSIPDSVTYIDHDAFAGCSALTGVTIPGGVTGIADKAFMNCRSLTSVTIPAATVSIGKQAFYGCDKLKAIYVAAGNKYYASDSGVLLNKDQTQLLCCLAGRTSAYTIPGSVTTMDEYAFAGGKLSGVTIPGSLTAIPNNAFPDCSKLQRVTIHQGVTSIGSSAFSGCSSLSQISLPDGLTTINSEAFIDCSSLLVFDIPTSVTTLGAAAFRGCSGLEEVSIPQSITSIGNSTFEDCSALHTVWFGGTRDQWSRISIDNHNEPLENAVVICEDDLAITSQPVDFTGAAGSTIKFTVEAQGDGLTYQWYFKRSGETAFNKSTVTAAKKATFTMTMADKYDGWQYYCIVKDASGGTAQSNTVTIHKATPLAITTQPKNYTGAVGSTAALKVTAQGDGLTYQWYCKRTGESSFAKSTLSSATKATLSLTLQDKHDGYQYYCKVKDSYGNTVNSNTVKISIGTPLKITTQPKNYTGTAGSTATFKVAAQGDGLTYQWYCKKTGETSFSKSTLSSATKATLSLTLQAKHDGYQYYCKVKDSHGNTVNSNTVKVIIGTPLKITTQPGDYTGAVGSTVKFTVAAQGDGLTYQWWYKKADADSFVKSTLASGKKATYSMTLAERHDGWQYYCVVKDAYGQTVQSDTVTIHLAPPLTITTQPGDYTGAVGSTVKFTVAAQGDGLTYQWWYKKADASSFVKSTLASGKKASYSMTLAERHDGWRYYCIVKDAYGQTVQSDTVKISIGNPLKITTQPASFTGTVGTTAKLKVVAQGDGLTYQWYCKKTGESSFSKSTLSSATKATLSLTLQQKHEGYQYYCKITDSHGSTVKSNTVTIHVN